MERIRWDQGRRLFVLADGRSDKETFTIESTTGLSLASIRRALARRAGASIPRLGSLPSPETYGSYLELVESQTRGPEAEIIFEIGGSNWIFFFLTEQGHLRVHFGVDYPVIFDMDTAIEITKRVFGGVCLLVEELNIGDGAEDLPAWYFYVICNPEGQGVASFWELYKTLCFALTTSPDDLVKSAEGVRLALRLGHPEVLIGTPESSWLDAKSMDYFISSPTEKIKLAQDVARFANANGGLLVLGLKTSKLNGQDTISRVTPLPLPARSIAHYQA